MINNRYYYYISIWSPVGVGGYFYRDTKHPLDPNTMANHILSLSRRLSLTTKELVPPESIAYISLHELPVEVVKERWPEDFENARPPQPL